MLQMNIEHEIRTDFFLTASDVLSDEFIMNNTDILCIKEKVDYMRYLPCYMVWCLKNRDVDGNLVCDHTIGALAEFGRAKDASNRLNFKFLCNNSQRVVVYNFLQWCLSNLYFCNTEQVNRAIKSWGRLSLS